MSEPNIEPNSGPIRPNIEPNIRANAEPDLRSDDLRSTVEPHRGNRWGLPLAGLGALLLAAAAILSWAVVPGKKQMPADTNTTRQLTGTAKVLLNPVALAAGDVTNALVTNVPVTAERNVKVLATSGNAAQVADTRVLKAPTGQELGRSETVYAVDRKTLEAAKDHPADWEVVDHQGLTVSWPIGAEKKDYVAWVNETKSTTPVKYAREEKKADISAYVYEASTAPTPITDEAILSTLPKALPATALAAIAGRLPLPDAAKAQLAQALPALGDPVPLAYTYQVKSTYWVEPTTGLVLDIKRDEIRNVSLANGALAAPVYDLNTTFTEQSVTDAAKDATDKRNSLETFGKTLPLLLSLAGLAALAIGLIAWLLGRRRQTV